MSIRKISKELGLSSATVSWILSGQGEQRGFKEQTIKRVKEYADSINYRPNLVARNLSKGSTRTIGVIIPYISDTYFAAIVQEIETQAHQRHYNLTICSSAGDPARELELIDLMLSQQVDGVIIAPGSGVEESIARLNDRGCPFVLVDRRSINTPTNYVVPNNLQCSCEITRRIASKGAKKIAIITSDSHLSAMKERLAGYIAGLIESGLSFDESLVIDVNRLNYIDRGPEMITDLLQEHSDLDGIFFATHYLALGAIKYFSEQGIDYNSRFKMATIYNVPWLKLLAPEIIIAAVPIKEIGSRAVDILCNHISDKESPLSQLELNNEFV